MVKKALDINDSVPGDLARTYGVPITDRTPSRQVVPMTTRKTNKPQTYEYRHQFPDGHMDLWYFQLEPRRSSTPIWEIYAHPDNRYRSLQRS